jgi:hypothetical protein
MNDAVYGTRGRLFLVWFYIVPLAFWLGLVSLACYRHVFSRSCGLSLYIYIPPQHRWRRKEGRKETASRKLPGFLPLLGSDRSFGLNWLVRERKGKQGGRVAFRMAWWFEREFTREEEEGVCVVVTINEPGEEKELNERGPDRIPDR